MVAEGGAFWQGLHALETWLEGEEEQEGGIRYFVGGQLSGADCFVSGMAHTLIDSFSSHDQIYIDVILKMMSKISS